MVIYAVKLSAAQDRLFREFCDGDPVCDVLRMVIDRAVEQARCRGGAKARDSVRGKGKMGLHRDYGHRQRHCLQCNVTFMSYGPGNRLCARHAEGMA